MNRLILVFAVFVLSTLSTCAAPQVEIAEGPRTYQPADYQDIFFKWSREESIIPMDGANNVLTARATWKSYDFRWAYVVKVAHDYRLSPDERQLLRDEQFSALDAHLEFFVSATSSIKGADELVPGEGPWRIRLEDDAGRQLAAEEVAPLRKPDPAQLEQFHHNPHFRKAYQLRFPLTFEDGQPVLSAETRYIQLTFSSTLGQLTLRWEIAQDFPPRA